MPVTSVVVNVLIGSLITAISATVLVLGLGVWLQGRTRRPPPEDRMGAGDLAVFLGVGLFFLAVGVAWIWFSFWTAPAKSPSPAPTQPPAGHVQAKTGSGEHVLRIVYAGIAAALACAALAFLVRYFITRNRPKPEPEQGDVFEDAVEEGLGDALLDWLGRKLGARGKAALLAGLALVFGCGVVWTHVPAAAITGWLHVNDVIDWTWTACWLLALVALLAYGIRRRNRADVIGALAFLALIAAGYSFHRWVA